MTIVSTTSSNTDARPSFAKALATLGFTNPETLIVRLFLLLSVSFNLYYLSSEVRIRAPFVNDGIMHLVALERAVTALAAGQDPTDPWLTTMVMGYPLFHYYQHLPYVLPALIQFLLSLIFRPAPPLVALYSWTLYVLLSLFPLSIYWSMRWFGFSRLPAALAALAGPVISTNGLFGFDFNSYVWRGYGLYTQLWGMLLLPLALARGYVTLRDGRGYFWSVVLLSGTALSHLAFGYIAFVSLVVFAFLVSPGQEIFRRVRRMLMLLAPVALATSYFLLPLLLDSSYLNRSVWDAQQKYDSYGHEWVLGAHVRGELFDYGRFPSLTLLAGIGLAACLWRWKHEQHRIAATLSIVWLLHYFGRPTWGPLLDLTPLSGELYMHRLIAGVHLGGIFLIGLGLAAFWSLALARKSAWYLGAAFLATGLLLAPVYRERVAYLDWNTHLMLAGRDATEREETDLSALVEWLRQAPAGRVYAGLAGTWGSRYRIGDAPVYALLTLAGIDNLSFLYHPWSLNGDVQVLFDEGRPEQYNLFNIRYVVAAADRSFPDFVKPVQNFGRHRLYQVETSGYFELVGSELTLVGGKREFYPVASRWLASDMPRVKQHPSLILGQAPTDYARSFPLSLSEGLIPGSFLPAEPSRGELITEMVESNSYRAAVRVERESMLMLKVTYHPNWRAYVNGLETQTVMLIPSYTGVSLPPGNHLVRFEYRPQALRSFLMLAGLVTLVLVATAERRAVALAALVQRLAVPALPQVAWPLPTRLRTLAASSVALGQFRAELPLLGWVALAVLLSGLPRLQMKLMAGHDALEYLPRNVEFYRALTGGQLIPRWAPDLSGGYGEPFFSFNPPLIYYLSAFFHAFGASFIASENLASLVLLLFAGLGMYFLGREFFGRHGGVVSAAAYLFAPYLHSRLYVSHALADFSAFAPLPWTFWALYRFADGGSYRFLAIGALSTAFLLLSSNPVALITLPALSFAALWVAVCRKSATVLLRGCWCLLLGLGLAAFFWLPAFIERDYVHTRRLLESFLNYRNHFAYFYQLINSPWGYGVSLPGPGDGMSFALGPLHLAVAAGALLLLPRVRRASIRSAAAVVFVLVVGALAAFFSIFESAFLWERLPLIQYLEYPWRFHVLLAVGTAFLFGCPFLFLTGAWQRLAKPVAAGLLVLVVGLNFTHARPEKFLEVNEADYAPQRIAARYIAVTTAREYEPIWVRERPAAPAAEPVTLLAGQGRLSFLRHTPTHGELRADITEDARLRINTFYFPGWTLYVNGAERPIDRSSAEGLIELSLERGTHDVRLVFEDTPIRLWATRLSLVAVLLLAASGWHSGRVRSISRLIRAFGLSTTLLLVLRRSIHVRRTIDGLYQLMPARQGFLGSSTLRLVLHPRAGRYFRSLFVVLLFALMVLIALTFPDYGLGWDEERHRTYGELAVRWYSSLFRDDSIFQHLNLYLYGAFFDLLSQLVSHLIPIGFYEGRHLLTAFFGFSAVVLVYLTAVNMAGYMSGFFSTLFILATPAFYGHLFVNHKDIPFATLFLLSLYLMIRVGERTPRPGNSLLVILGLAIGLTMGIRVGGALLLGYLALSWTAQLLWKRRLGLVSLDLRSAVRYLLIPLGLTSLIAWLVMLLFWPWAQLSPILNPIKALLLTARFTEWQGRVFFDGQFYDSDKIPPHYLPTWFAVSLPEFYFVAILLGCFLAASFVLKLRGGSSDFSRAAKIGLLVIAICAPIVAATLLRSVVYDGIRQFLFVLPLLAVLAGVSTASFLRSRHRGVLKVSMGGLLLGSVFLTTLDMLQLHPYEYVYFNRLFGGSLTSAATRFETDYWGLSYKEGAEWLVRNYRPDSAARIRVANCSARFQSDYFLEKSPEGRQRFVGVPPNGDPQIFLATTRFGCQALVRGDLLHVVSRMGTPLLYIFEVRR